MNFVQCYTNELQRQVVFNIFVKFGHSVLLRLNQNLLPSYHFHWSSNIRSFSWTIIQAENTFQLLQSLCYFVLMSRLPMRLEEQAMLLSLTILSILKNC